MNNLSRAVMLLLLLIPHLTLAGCSESEPEIATTTEEVEAIARTEFTDRLENFFEYEPLRAGKPSQFVFT
jgi:hypothetical protein